MKNPGIKYSIDEIQTASMFVYWMIAIHNSGHHVTQKEKASAQLAFD